MRTRKYLLQFRKNIRFVLTLFIAPLSITLLAEMILQLVKAQSIPVWQTVITFIFALLFALLLIGGYSKLFDNTIISSAKKKRSKLFKNPKVLVLDGRIEDTNEVAPEPAITNNQPTDWKRALTEPPSSHNVDIGPIELIRKSQIYQVVVNPFGEAYPEEDIYTYQTFEKICDYVFSGGVFVNVAGIPFWYCHDPRDPQFIGKRVIAGQIRRDFIRDETTIIQNRLLISLFPQLRDLSENVIVETTQSSEERRIFGDLTNAGGDSKAKMFRAYRPGTSGAIPLLRSENPDHWLIISMKYGDGFFLLAGFDLRGEGHSSFSKVVMAIKSWIEFEARGRK
jgi:hypothetical protein